MWRLLRARALLCIASFTLLVDAGEPQAPCPQGGEACLEGRSLGPTADELSALGAGLKCPGLHDGPDFATALAAKFKAPNRDVLSKEMMEGTSLSPSECTAVVDNPLFEQWEAHLAAGDYKKAAALSSPQTKFGKSVTRGWIFFQEHAGSASAAKSAKLNPDDTQ